MNIRTLSRAALLLAGLSILFSCAPRSPKKTETGLRTFPTVKVPSVCSGQEEIADYVLTHFWDGYFDSSNSWLTDSLHMAGVDRKEMVSQISSYMAILENSPLEKAQKSISGLMDKLEAYHDTDTLLYGKMTKMLSSCLYDPNSELRDEDIYYPVVTRLASSPYTPDNMRGAYAYDASMCALNAKGTKAEDFDFMDASGQPGSLYGIDTEYTALIFVNPGCHACGEVVAPFSSEPVMNLIAAGRLTVLGMYIDEEVDKWLEGRDELPPHWLNAYDPSGVIRTDVTYSVRAIPSIYILDRDKTVIMKDAVPQRAIAFLETLQ